MKRLILAAMLGLLAGAPGRADAALILFEANLSGLQEVPPNASPGTGFGQIILDDVLNQITVELSFQDLLAAAVAAHIHGPASPGVNAPVLFPLDLTGAFGSSGTIAPQVFAITPVQIAQLEAGLFYFNVHTSVFPGGEIRGQALAVAPEPSALATAAVGALVVAGAARRRRARG
jgi:hypothetical protein